jgi:hypothetical protein
MMQARKLRVKTQNGKDPQLQPLVVHEPVNTNETRETEVRAMDGQRESLCSLTGSSGEEVGAVTRALATLQACLRPLVEQNAVLRERLATAEREATTTIARLEGALRNEEVLMELLRGEVDEETWVRIVSGYSQAK